MSKKARQWKIEDLINFEACVVEFKADLSGDQLIQANIIRPLLEQRINLKGAARQQLVFYAWMKHRLKQLETDPSLYWRLGYTNFSRVMVFIAGLFGFFAVAGIVRWSDQALNIGLMVGSLVVLPWLLFLGFSFWSIFSRGRSGMLIGWLKKKVMVKFRKNGYPIDTFPNSLKVPLKRLLFHTLQKASMVYALTGILTMLALVLFFDIRFYWESTLGADMAEVWRRVGSLLSFPWAWSGIGTPDGEDVKKIQTTAVSDDGGAAVQMTWAYFAIGCVLVWSLIPRLILTLLARWRLRSSLGKIVFEEKRHRQLWRRLFVQGVGTEHQLQEDTAILVDYGGWNPEMQVVRPFILQKLRLDPKYRAEMDSFNNEAEQQVIAFIQQHDIPVILCCEASELSPKSLEAAIRKLKMFRDDLVIHVIALSADPRELLTDNLLDLWWHWIDELADPNVRLSSISSEWLDKWNEERTID